MLVANKYTGSALRNVFVCFGLFIFLIGAIGLVSNFNIGWQADVRFANIESGVKDTDEDISNAARSVKWLELRCHDNIKKSLFVWNIRFLCLLALGSSIVAVTIICAWLTRR